MSAQATSRADHWLANSWAPEQLDAVRAAYSELSRLPAFAIVAEDLARYAGLRQSSFVAGKGDQMHFLEGQRDMVFHLLEMAGFDLILQPKMQP